MSTIIMGLPAATAARAALPLLLAGAALLSTSRASDVGLSIRTEPIPRGEGGAAERSAGSGRRQRSRQRHPKLINFSTDNSHIGVELGFTVPLLKVPLEGARSDGAPHGLGGSAFKEPIDINIGALFVAGSMLVTVMGIVPAVYQAFAKPHHAQFARAAPDAEPGAGWLSGAGKLLGTAEAELARRGVDVWSCGGQALCTTLAGAAQRVQRGRAGSLDLVLHGLARSPWASKWVTGTELQDAASGEEDTDRCMQRFTRCQLPFNLTRLLYDNREQEIPGELNAM